MFYMEKMSIETSIVTPELLDEVANRIVESVHPTKIILFGSWARGSAREDSDVDLLVVTAAGGDRRKEHKKIEQALRGRKFAMDLLVRTPEEVTWNIEVENPFYQNDIFGEGKVLYEQ